MGTPGPYFSRKNGTQVHTFPGKWGPWSPYYLENGYPGSPISRKYGDLLVKMGPPCMFDCFSRSMRTICIAGHNHRNMGMQALYGWSFLWGLSVGQIFNNQSLTDLHTPLP